MSLFEQRWPLAIAVCDARPRLPDRDAENAVWLRPKSVSAGLAVA